jgi:two-component sensor histidine kinase
MVDSSSANLGRVDYECASECEILKEIHHQVKNSLQVVCSLLRLEGRHAKSSEDRVLFRRSEQRVQTMALMYDALHRSHSPFLVPLHEYISDLSAQLVRSIARCEEPPRLELQLDSVFVPTKPATSLGLIVSEVLTRRLTCPISDQSRRTIVISLRQYRAGLSLDICDNAAAWIGDSDPSAALSTQIVAALVQQLGGTIETGSDGEAFCRVVIPELSQEYRA